MCAPVSAREAASNFDAANKLYEQGKFAEAAAAYEKLLPPGSSSPVIYFNLGNAFFKSGQIGRAIAAYEQAELLTPRDPEIRANLRFARNQVQGPAYRATPWESWVNQLTLNEWALLTMAVLWLFFALLVLGQVRPALKSNLRALRLLSGLALVALCFCLGAAHYQWRQVQRVVVVKQEVVVRHGPLDVSPSAFTVFDGAELRVLDHKDDWLEVTAGPQRTGWLRKADVLAILHRYQKV